MDWVVIVKWIHVVSSTVLFGTGVGIAYFFWMVQRGYNAATRAGVARLVVKADWTFTLIAGIVQALTGGLLVYLQGYSLADRWLKEAITIFVVALLCWLPVVWLQIKLRDMAVAAAATDSPLPQRYRTYLWSWFALGWPAFLGLVYVFYLMIEKPV